MSDHLIFLIQFIWKCTYIYILLLNICFRRKPFESFQIYSFFTPIWKVVVDKNSYFFGLYLCYKICMTEYIHPHCILQKKSINEEMCWSFISFLISFLYVSFSQQNFTFYDHLGMNVIREIHVLARRHIFHSRVRKCIP